MTWDGRPRRNEDHGGESVLVVLARIEERSKALNEKMDDANSSMDQHFKDDKNSFAAISAKVESENNKLRVDIEKKDDKNEADFKWIRGYLYMAMGAMAVIMIIANNILIPIAVQRTIKKMNHEVGLLVKNDKIA